VLGPDLVEGWLASNGATSIKDDQRRNANGAKIPEHVISAMLNGRAVRVEVRAYGSANAFKDLASGSADVGMASRPVNDNEVRALAALGDMHGLASEHVLGLDGIAVIVPQSNTVRKLSTAQLKGLFEGQITDWSQVGGKPGPVHLYVRDEQSGTYDTFEAMVLAGGALATAKRYDDSATLELDVSRDRDGVGFIGMPYVETTRAVAIGDGPAPALLPTVLNVKTESYPLTRRLFLYTAAQPTNLSALQFVEFALSDPGQEIVKQAQFVNLELRQPKAPTDSQANMGCMLSARWRGDRNDYCKLRADAEQLETSLRFRAGSAALDSRATRDLRRVVEAVPRTPAPSVVLAGFADSSGSYDANCGLARKRAQTVAQALATLGLEVADIRGFCNELPVRAAGTDGREENRGVEIFIVKESSRGRR
jgi:phosphate transport system substrate-binding protein